jgi:Phage integrase, N-terminal SAM-like domain
MRILLPSRAAGSSRRATRLSAPSGSPARSARPATVMDEDEEEADGSAGASARRPDRAEFLAYGKANRQNASTQYARAHILNKHLVPFLGTKRLDEITESDVQEIKARLARASRRR